MRDMAHSICLIKLSNNEKKFRFFVSDYLNSFGEGGQNVLQNGNFCLYFDNSRKGPIFKASDES